MTRSRLTRKVLSRTARSVLNAEALGRFRFDLRHWIWCRMIGQEIFATDTPTPSPETCL